MSMTEHALRVPEVARRLGVDGAEVYGLILGGELPAAKGEDGLVCVTAEALEEFQRRYAPTPQ
jgi:Helix-turn-helix domain